MVKDPCGRPEWAPCQTKPGFCKTTGVTYQIECQDCKSQGIKSLYIGESNRTFYDRALDHQKALKNQNTTYGIVRHWKDQHPNSEEPPKFNYTLLKRHKTCLERQIFEALTIETIECHNIMNGKGEWGRNLIPRLQNFPEEDFRNTQHQSQDSQGTQILTRSTTKRTALGFTKIPSEDPQQVLKLFPKQIYSQICLKASTDREKS